MSASANFRHSMLVLAILSAAGSTAITMAQLPPRDFVLSEPRPALLTIKAFDVHLRAATAFSYDDNISLYEKQGSGVGIQTGRKQPPLGDDFIYTFAPGIRLDKATGLDASPTALSVDYSPSFIFFLKNDSENSIDHNAQLKAGYGLTKLTLGVVQDFVSTAGGVVDVGNRVSQINYTTTPSLRYELTEKTFFEVNGQYRIIDYETLTDSEEWNATPTVNYQISPKVALGLGMRFGQLYVGEQSQIRIVTRNATNTFTKTTQRGQTYLGPAVRASYRTTEKTDFSLSVGGEWRTYPDGRSSFGPVFSLLGTYRPFEGTSFTVEGHRRELNSAVINGANYISTGVSLGAQQRLRERLFGTLNISFDNAEYVPTERGVQTSRNDDYFLLRYGLDAILGRSWTIGIFHQYREDVSSDQRFSFDNNQVGIQAAWGY